MRLSLLLASMSLAVLACGGGDDSQAIDTTSSAPGGTVGAAPGSGSVADSVIAGTWAGRATMPGSDSVIARFTQICANGTCLGVLEGTTDTTSSTYRIEGDSIVGSSAPYESPDFGNVRVIDGYVLRPVGDSLSGSGTVRLADRDSVLVRLQFTATRVRR